MEERGGNRHMRKVNNVKHKVAFEVNWGNCYYVRYVLLFSPLTAIGYYIKYRIAWLGWNYQHTTSTYDGSSNSVFDDVVSSE